MGMSKDANGNYRNKKKKQGVVKTEVPTKVHWVKRKCEVICNFIVSLIFTNILMHTVENLALPRFTIPCSGYTLNLALTHNKIKHFPPCPYVPILYMEMNHLSIFFPCFFHPLGMLAPLYYPLPNSLQL